LSAPEFRSVEPLLQPQTIAIVGASETGGDGWSRVLFHNLKEAGFPARTYLINPRRDELWGHKVYPDFASLPEPIDHALVVVPAKVVNGVMRDGVAHGLKAATIYSAGFGEGRKRLGTALGEELKAIIAESGISVCGPNCMGTFSIARDILLYPTSRLRGLAKGDVGGIFHSGGTLGYWFAQAGLRGLGFSYAVSCGNEFGLDAADYLNFLVSDPDTRVIVAMLESIRRPDAFMEAARRAFDAGKPVTLVKLGGTERGKEQARSHTGAVAVDDEVFNAVCDRYGITRCANIDEMVDAALAFRYGRLPRGDRLAVVTSSGGAVGLTLDSIGAEGARLAELSPETVAQMEALVPVDVDVHNPMDAGSALASDVERFCKLCQLFAEDDNVDLVAMQGRIPLPDDKIKYPEPYIKLQEATDKPVLGFSRMVQNADDNYRTFQHDAGMPFLFGVPATIRSAQALVRYGARRRAGIPALPHPQGAEADLEPGRLAARLAGLGVTPPREAVAADAEQAAAAAAEIGFPVALKVVSDEALHKTEIGGLRLNLADGAAVRQAAAEMAASMGDVPLRGFLVQEMVDGLEMLVGVRDDPQFGPLVVVGLGGVFVELLKDVSLRLAPVDEAEARAMLGELRGAKALDGFRGQAPRDVDALARAIAGLSSFYLDHRTWLSDLEINPLMVLAKGEGVRAVDVRPVRRA